jgi:hypothetical protein
MNAPEERDRMRAALPDRLRMGGPELAAGNDAGIAEYIIPSGWDDETVAVKQFVITAAGQIAERRVWTPKGTGGWSADLRAMAECFEKIGADESQRNALVDAAEQLVVQHWPAIERVAEALQRRKELSGEEVAALFAEPTKETA